jgi:hypothetical protein
VTTVIVRASCEDVAMLRKTIHEWIISKEIERMNWQNTEFILSLTQQF